MDSDKARAEILLDTYNNRGVFPVGYIEIDFRGLSNMDFKGSKMEKEEIVLNIREAEALVWCVKRSWWNMSDEDIAEHTRLSLEEAHVFTEKAVMGGLLNFAEYVEEGLQGEAEP